MSGERYSLNRVHSADWSSWRQARRRVSSVVENLSANQKVPGSIPGPVSYWGHGLL